MKLLITLVVSTLFAIAAKAQTYNKGSKVEVNWSSGTWYKATVTEVDGNQYKVHLDDYSDSYDQWVTKEKLRTIQTNDGRKAAPTNTNRTIENVDRAATANQRPNATNNSTNVTTDRFAVGTTLEAKQGSRWYIASIKEIKNGKYLVKYDGYNEEEWVTTDRLRVKASLPADKLKGSTGKVFIRSIRWIATGNTELSWWFFGDNGIVVNNPVYGVNPINLAAEQQDNYKNLGHYVMEGNNIKITWLNGIKTEFGLTYKNGEIIEMDAGGIMVRQTGLGDNYKISGTFNGSSSFGNIKSSGTYTFSKNGSVSVTKAGYANAGVTNGRTENSKTGTYYIKGNTLVINFSDGTKNTSTIGVFGANKLVINGEWFSSQ